MVFCETIVKGCDPNRAPKLALESPVISAEPFPPYSQSRVYAKLRCSNGSVHCRIPPTFPHSISGKFFPTKERPAPSLSESKVNSKEIPAIQYGLTRGG